MRIAHFGTFDVDNYGDLIFPHIARYKWPNYNWVHITPTNNKPSFSDSLPTINVENALKEKFNAVVIGGGNIINSQTTSLENYKKVADYAYPSLWIGAANLASKQQIPLVYNAPGIFTTPQSYAERKLFRLAFSRADYLSFREHESAQIASSLTSNELFVIPDTAFDIDRMWPIIRDVNKSYIAVNVNQRYHSPPEESAKFLKFISKRLNLSIKFIVIGACHGDDHFTRRVQEKTNIESEIVTITSLYEMAHSIGNAKYFIGSSMHGFITALSYRVPSLLVLNNNPLKKFIGLIKIADLPPTVICPNWENALQQLNNPAIISEKVKNNITVTLDNHWKLMEIKIFTKKVNKQSIILKHWEKILLIDRKLKRALAK